MMLLTMTQFRNCSNALALLLLAIPFAPGCGGDANSPDLHPVSGTVTMDGKPLDSATVFFRPSGTTKGTGSFGKTDASGKYTLRTDRGGEGAVEGTYDVMISREVNADGTPVADVAVDPNAPAEAGGGLRESVPAAYSDYQRPTLNATVPPGGTTADFALKSKP
jgi:hypothetical protein